MKPGITACLICYNEMWWLPKTFPPMLEHADQIVVVEGSPDGGSTDGTHEYVKRLLRQQDVLIDHVQCNWGMAHNWDIAMRNAYLPFVDYSHVLMIDADEMYTEAGWQGLRCAIAEMALEKAWYLSTPKVHFFKDYDHVITIGPFASWTHNFWKYDPGAKYKDISTIPVMTDGYYVTTHKVMLSNKFSLYHYGHASPSEKYRARQRKFLQRVDGGGLTPELIAHWDARWTDDRRVDAPGVSVFTGWHPMR